MDEFEFLDGIKGRFRLGRIGDDCAVLPKDHDNDLLVTADLLVEDIDFRLDWTTRELLGHKSLAVSLSDIAAMGGTPVWAMLSIGVPENLWKTDFLERFYEGWHVLAGDHRVELVGGDISRSPDKLVIDSIVGGTVQRGKALLRSGARVGDAIAVTGTIGGSAGGLQLLLSGHRNDPSTSDARKALVTKHLKPQPQVSIGNLLTANGLATATIDVSDGLSSDLGHLCSASRVGARIYAEKLPLHPDLTVVWQDEETALEYALNGGEDFELLFTVPSEKARLLDEMPDVTIVGEITAEPGRTEIMKDGQTHILRPGGFRHF